VRLIIDAGPDVGSDAARHPAPQAPHSPELIHGLGNLLQNAIEFARSEVRVTARWSERRISLKIQDDGPGFAPGLLDHLGEPYLSGGEEQGRIGTGEPMGLGVFIAQTLLGRTGAQLSFGNGQDGGPRLRLCGTGPPSNPSRRPHDEVRDDQARDGNAVPDGPRCCDD
jgi:two-component system sensor histidine kinase RegB